jgi:glyoxylase-like metal-dependent hydrolase (beta-lactamase superfamily II)
MVVKIKKYENEEVLQWKWASDNELIPSPFFTSCFFIDGVLIDSGAPASVELLRGFIEPLTKEYEIKCILTHSHEDHCGGARMLQQEFDIPIYADKKAIPSLKKEYTYPKYRQMTWGEKRLSVKAKEVPETITSNSGRYEFEKLPMPGHAPDQFALIEDEQEWAFVADAVQPKYRMLFGKESDIQEDIQIIYESIQKLYNRTKGMNELKIFTSSRGMFTGREFLQEKLSEIEEMHKNAHQIYDELSEEYEKKDRLLGKVLKEFIGRESVIGKLTRGDLSKMNLLKSLLQWPL